MREYETTFIIQPELSDEGVQAICERLEGVLEKAGATKLFYDDMGRRRLAYPIKKFQKGQYLTLFFLDEGKAGEELERALRLDDSVLRFLTVLGNPNVADIEARKAEAVELEKLRAERAAERAQREAEEAARAEEEARERAAAFERGEAEAAAAAAAAPEEGEAAAATEEGEAPAAEPSEEAKPAEEAAGADESVKEEEAGA